MFAQLLVLLLGKVLTDHIQRTKFWELSITCSWQPFIFNEKEKTLFTYFFFVQLISFSVTKPNPLLPPFTPSGVPTKGVRPHPFCWNTRSLTVSLDHIPCYTERCNSWKRKSCKRNSWIRKGLTTKVVRTSCFHMVRHSYSFFSIMLKQRLGVV